MIGEPRSQQPPAAPGELPEAPPSASELAERLLDQAVDAWAGLSAVDPVWLLRQALVSVLVISVALALRALLGYVLRRLRARITRTGAAQPPVWRVLARIADLAVLAVAVVALAEVWGADLAALLSTGPGAAVVRAFAGIGLVVLLAALALQLAEVVLQRTLGDRIAAQSEPRQAARLKTLMPVLRGVAQAVILTFAALLILSELGVNLGPLLAGAGIVGVAVGFGAQSLVKDFLVGVMLLLEDAASIGDVVKVGDHAGLVEHMGVRIMRLRDLEGIVHLIPYGEVTTIRNFTKDFAFALLDVGIAYREDVDEVIAVLGDIAAGLRQDEVFGPRILEDLEVLGVDAFADSAVVVKIRLKTQPIQQWSVAREFRRRIKRRFDELGIEIPFPHRTLYFGVDREGGAPPARLRLQGERDAGTAPAAE